MSFERFFELIDASPLGAAVTARRKLLENTDPNRIYVENVRSFFGFPFALARTLCDRAVKEGVFERCLALECPNEECQRILVEKCGDESFPEEIDCEVCEGLDREQFHFKPGECRTVEFYRLRREDQEL